MNSMSKWLVAVLAVSSAVACGPAIPEADVEGCEHIKEGPASAVTAVAGSTGAPAVKDDHKRYDLTLVDITGGKGGRVTFASDEAGDVAFFLNADVPFKVLNSSDQEVAFESSAKSIAACSEVKAKYVAHLEVASYTLSFGPTTQTSVGMVVEAAAH